MNAPSSPFSQNRFEYGGDHLYYLPESLYARLGQMKPAYLIGTRGTGKTTLLHAFNWKERLANESLKRQIKGDPFSDKCIGVYLKLPAYSFQRIEAWLSQSNETLRAETCALYLDLAWTELALKAICELWISRVLQFDPSNERKFASYMVSKFPALKNSGDSQAPSTFLDISTACQRIRRVIEESAKYDLEPVVMRDALPKCSMGEFGRGTCESLSAACDQFSQAGGWHFKVCIDEGEAAPDFVRVVFNSVIRISSWPCFFVVSFVRKPDNITQTLFQSLSIAPTDCQIIKLDQMSDDEFKGLAEGVASVRLQKVLGDNSCRFITERVLGRISINRVLEETIRSSESELARHLLAKAIVHTKSQYFIQRHSAVNEAPESDEPTEDAALPIYESYLFETLKLEIPTPETPRWRERSQESREIRKKMVSAYLSIMTLLKSEVKYFSSDMVFQISDKCIRDYIGQIGELHAESQLSAKDFISTVMAMKRQDIAIKRYSEGKRDALRTSGVRSPQETEHLVDSLAKITQQIQTTSDSTTHLRSTERGVFGIRKWDPEDKNARHIFRLLKEADEAGYLRFSAVDDSEYDLGNVLHFRVHCSLAPAYRFSYRGAYYATPVSMGELEALVKTSEVDRRQQLIRDLAKKFSGGTIDDGQQRWL